MSVKSDVSQSDDWLERLQESGYRLTGPRRAVVETVASSVFLLNPMEIFIQARQRYPALGLVTVYRTLDKLEELSLVQRVHQADGCNSYVAAARGHQHLLICRRCNRAEYFSGDDLSDLFASIGAEHGYRVDGHWLQLFGLCENCARDEKEGSGKNE